MAGIYLRVSHVPARWSRHMQDTHTDSGPASGVGGQGWTVG